MRCAFCDREFTGRKRKYCTKACCLLAHGTNPDYKPEPVCLLCGKTLAKGQKKYCSNGCCAKAYSRRQGVVPMSEYRENRKATRTRNEKDKQRRALLTDSMVKKTIYITQNRRAKGSIKYSDIAPEMIKEKRAQIVVWRERRANPKQKAAKPVMHCKVCGVKLEKRGSFCSNDCRLKNNRDYYYRNHTLSLEYAKTRYITIERDRRMGKNIDKPRKCKWCGKSFIVKYGDRRRSYCSPTCQKRSERYSDGNIRRINIVEHLPVERFKAIEIYERDGWRCGICGKRVNEKLKAPHRMSPSLDHIIPISKGGMHERKNVRLAHYGCNSKKGARASERGDQLLLFG